MKKLLLLLLLSLSLISSAYASSHFHNWPDDSICVWVKQKPTNEGYLNEARKRGLDCNGLVTAQSPTDESNTSSTSSDTGSKVTNALGYPDGELREPKSYSIFSSQASYFKKLVSNGMYLSAQKLFAKHRYKYFTKKSVWGEVPYDNLKKEFLAAANGLLTTFEPEVQIHFDAIEKVNLELKKSKSIPESKWSEYKKLLDKNSMMIGKYKSHKLVEFVIRKERKFNPPLKNKIYKEGEKLKSLVIKNAGSAFGNYDFINKDNFFSLYPVRLTAIQKKDVINLNSKYILSELDKASTTEANVVIKDYKFDTFKTDVRLDLISKQFNEYDILNKQDFFSSYSLTQTDKKEVINLSSKHILSKIDKASLEQATNLIKKYKLNDSSISFSNQLSGILLEKSIGGKKDLSVIDVVNALKSLSAVESDAKNVLPSKYQIAVLKITSEYSKELKIATSKILESPTTDINKAAKSPYIITVQSRIISLDRTDDEVKKIQSKYKSSSTMVQNSKYSRYQNEYQIAKDDLDRWNQDMETLKQWRRDAEAKHRADQAEARAQQQSYNNNNTSFNCTSNSYGYNTTTNCRQSNSYSGWGAMNAASASAGSSFANALNTWGYNDKVNEGNRAIASARQRMNSARSKLNSTPSQISKDTFTSYSFSTRTFDVTKNIERVVFLINNNLNTYSVFTIPHQEKKTFVFVNSLDRNDKTHRQNDYQNDDDIEIFVNKPDSFSIEQLIAMIPEEHQTKELEAPIEQVLQSIQYAFNEVTKNSNGNQELSQESSTTSQPESSNSDDYIEKIKEAKLLLEAGIISEEEFEEIKKKIIDNI